MQFQLGMIYHEANKSENKGYDVEAVKWWLAAAQQNHPIAQNNMGMAYLEGIGVKPDCKLALSWFHKSANLGERRAMYNLGDLYSKGLCVDQNKIQAETWYKKFNEAVKN